MSQWAGTIDAIERAVGGLHYGRQPQKSLRQCPAFGGTSVLRFFAIIAFGPNVGRSISFPEIQLLVYGMVMIYIMK